MKHVITAEQVVSLDDIIGNGIKFKDLCQRLNIEVPKSQNSRKSILTQLQQFCDIQEIQEDGKHPMYIITQIYKAPLLDIIHKNNKFQPYVEQAILELALTTKQSMIYLSNSAILEATYMVNGNFKIACSPSMAKLDDRAWVQPEANEIYSILYRWIRNRLKQMDARHIIQLQKGYRLYRTIKNAEGETITVYKNVPKNSKEDAVCQEIFATAIQRTSGVSKDWDGGWLPPSVYEEMRKKANQLCQQQFASEGWEKISVVNVIIPVQNENLIKRRLKDVSKTLNNESQRKVKDTSRLNHLTGCQRLQLAEELIALNPVVDYKKLLNEEKQKREND